VGYSETSAELVSESDLISNTFISVMLYPENGSIIERRLRNELHIDNL